MKNMFVMVDVVANHMGSGPIAENKPSPLDQPNSYHSACDIQQDDYDNNQTAVEVCRLAGLPDLFTESNGIRELFQNWIQWLVKEYSFDGIRIDTVKHVEKGFWPDFVEAAGCFALGEALNGNPDYLADYAELMPGLLDYATYYAIQGFYLQKSDAQRIVDMHSWIDRVMPDPTALGTFFDNHDQKRWLSMRNDQAVLKNVLAYTLLGRGIPIVYYGTEQGYSGAADPNNREDLWRSNFDTNSNLYQAISRLSNARIDAGGLSGDDHVHLYSTSSAYAWSRVDGDLIVLTTNTGEDTDAEHCFNTTRPNGSWANVFGDSGVHGADASGNICLQVSQGEPVVLLAGSVTVPPTSDPSTNSSTPSTKPSGTSPCATNIPVIFTILATTSFGDTIKVVGDHESLGNWDPDRGFALSADRYTAADPVWRGTLDILAASGEVDFKFVNMKKDGTEMWESDPNRRFEVPRQCPEEGRIEVDGGVWQAAGYVQKRQRIAEL